MFQLNAFRIFELIPREWTTKTACRESNAPNTATKAQIYLYFQSSLLLLTRFLAFVFVPERFCLILMQSAFDILDVRVRLFAAACSETLPVAIEVGFCSSHTRSNYSRFPQSPLSTVLFRKSNTNSNEFLLALRIGGCDYAGIGNAIIGFELKIRSFSPLRGLTSFMKRLIFDFTCIAHCTEGQLPVTVRCSFIGKILSFRTYSSFITRGTLESSFCDVITAMSFFSLNSCRGE